MSELTRLQRARGIPLALLALALATTDSLAQPAAQAPARVAPSAPAPAPAGSPVIIRPAGSVASAPAPSPVAGVRNKISAADLPSAESILEVHRESHGKDGPWLNALGWLARGALLVGDTAKARRYSREVRDEVGARLAKGATLATDRDAETALGAAVEVEAQLLQRSRGPREAAELLRRELAVQGTRVAYRSRLHKRLNMLSLVGSPAPELARDSTSAPAPPSLRALRGRPVVLFVWAEWCGDCKAQAASLGRVLERHRASGLACVALTRRYDESDSAIVAETARADSVWRAVYSALPDVRHAVSTASMVEYGGSSTPTFVFVDRKGVVRGYTPTRLTEEELERAVAGILRE